MTTRDPDSRWNFDQVFWLFVRKDGAEVPYQFCYERVRDGAARRWRQLGYQVRTEDR